MSATATLLAVEDAIADSAREGVGTFYEEQFVEAQIGTLEQVQMALLYLVNAGKLEGWIDFFDADGERIYSAPFDSPEARQEHPPDTSAEPEYFEARYTITSEWRGHLEKQVKARLPRCA